MSPRQFRMLIPFLALSLLFVPIEGAMAQSTSTTSPAVTLPAAGTVVNAANQSIGQFSDPGDELVGVVGKPGDRSRHARHLDAALSEANQWVRHGFAASQFAQFNSCSTKPHRSLTERYNDTSHL